MIRKDSYRLSAAAVAVLLLLLVGCAHPKPGTFATPEEAVAAVAALAGSHDDRKTEEIFGPGSVDMFRSGDEAEDARLVQFVKAGIAEKVGFDEIDANTRVALFGKNEWPFPIPLVREGDRWRFDTASGREELLNRRIGYYELATLDSLHEYVDAQREYAAEGRDGNPRAFAQRFRSSAGKRDGLYWPVAEGEPASPLGDRLAEAAKRESDAPQAFRGYYYRILTGQGRNAPGGEKSYLDGKGLMTGGFAAIAWPAKYGNSGVMTFLVNQHGMVYQKDLGSGTAEAAAAIAFFDPDTSWAPTGDRLQAVAGAEDEDVESPPGT